MMRTLTQTFIASLVLATPLAPAATAGSDQQPTDDPARLAGRRTPVVDVFENNRDADIRSGGD